MTPERLEIIRQCADVSSETTELINLVDGRNLLVEQLKGEVERLQKIADAHYCHNTGKVRRPPSGNTPGLPMSVAEARDKNVCRICGMAPHEGPGYPFIYRYDERDEYAHRSCLDKEAAQAKVPYGFNKEAAKSEPQPDQSGSISVHRTLDAMKTSATAQHVVSERMLALIEELRKEIEKLQTMAKTPAKDPTDLLTPAEQEVLDTAHDGGDAIVLAGVVRRLGARVKKQNSELHVAPTGYHSYREIRAMLVEKERENTALKADATDRKAEIDTAWSALGDYNTDSREELADDDERAGDVKIAAGIQQLGEVAYQWRQDADDARDAKAENERLRKRNVLLRAVMDAADVFLAQPPADMWNGTLFDQQTTAGDCRELNRAYCAAVEGTP